MKNCLDCVFFNEISNSCSALKNVSEEEFEKLCNEATDKCSLFLTVESAKYYATVRNGIFTSLGDPIDFGRKVAKSLKASVDKSAELHDKT